MKLPVRFFAIMSMLLLCGYVDFATGYEVSVFLIYIIPIAAAGWWLGAMGGVFVVLLATGVWVVADVACGHSYSHPLFLYVNAGNRMVSFLLAVTAIRYVKARQSRMAERLQAFSGDVPVCTQCHRIGAHDGFWRPIEGHLVEFGHATLNPKVCPDCARRAYARAPYRFASEHVN